MKNKQFHSIDQFTRENQNNTRATRILVILEQSNQKRVDQKKQKQYSNFKKGEDEDKNKHIRPQGQVRGQKSFYDNSTLAS